MIDEYATTDNYAALARAIIALAATDLIATKRPKAMREYIKRWQYYQSPGNRPKNLPQDQIKVWCNGARVELLEFFAGGGGQLAYAAGCYHYIRLATRGRVTHKVLRAASCNHRSRARVKALAR
jgi:hypothetical protein